MDVCLNVWVVDRVVTQLMLLCCVNPFGGKGGGTPRSVFGRFSGVKGCCAIAARRPGPPLTPEPRRPLGGSCGQARACPRGARRPAADHGGCAGQAAGVGCAAARRRKTWRAM
jgi:hypothetical protein